MKNYFLISFFAFIFLFIQNAEAQLVPVEYLVGNAQTPFFESEYQLRINNLFSYSSFYNYGTANCGDTDGGKRYWSQFLAEMYRRRNNPTSAEALELQDGLASGYCASFYKPFTFPGYCYNYFLYKKYFSESMLNTVQNNWNSEGRTNSSRIDGKMDPIYSCTEFNSENFCWMARLGGYLLAQEFDDNTLVQGKPAQQYYDNFVKNWVRGTFNCGRVEWNSHVYSGFCLQASAVLYESAADKPTQLRGKAVSDWIMMEQALHYLDGGLVGPESRNKTGGYLTTDNGSIAPYLYLYFADSQNGINITDYQYRNFYTPTWTSGFFLHFKYRPPQVVVDIAQRKFNLPIEMHNTKPFYHLDYEDYKDWQGNTNRSRRFEFETTWFDYNYTLASLATFRPAGWVGTFSEQCLWRLGVKNTIDTSGVLQLFGNSGNYSDIAGRNEYEEIAQFRNVMIRMIKGSSNIWVAIPKLMEANYYGDTLYVDTKADVYIAIIPYNHTGKTSNLSFKPNHAQYKWNFNTNTLGTIVMEVGTKQQHGSLSNFRENIQNIASIINTGTNQLQYTSSQGNKLKMEYLPTTTYTMQCQSPLTTAGVVPNIWFNDVLNNFYTWNAYEVVYGDKIVEQKWGSGILSMKSNENELKIVVDPNTADVTYFAPKSAKPIFSNSGGVILPPIGLSMSTITSKSEIRYTLDGTEPTATSLLYSGTIAIGSPTYVKAKTFRYNFAESETQFAYFTVDGSILPTPLFSPVPGTYNGNQMVRISCPIEGTEIRYTTNGTEPDTNSPLFLSDISVTSNMIIQAKAYKNGMTESAIGIGEYSLIIPTSINTKINNENQLNLYPNPVINELTIQLVNDYKGLVIVKIYDTLGRNVDSFSFEKNTQSAVYQMNVANYNSGLYLIGVLYNGKLEFKKIKIK